MAKRLKALAMLLAGASVQLAPAATWCVGPACSFPTIGAAVSSASAGDVINIQAGIYNESVTISKSLSLVGSGSGTIINAIGQANGIFIDGTAKMPDAGVSHVLISGLTVANANFEGILVANASDVTISNNLVINNTRSLNINNATCPDQPDYETNEGFDCGEGIHLMGVHHSVVSGNTIKNNAGGILLSDETGATHDNIIMNNVATNNPYDCGITLASHSPAPNSGLMGPAGVYNNVIAGNTSTNNGLLVPGAGAGVGIFAAGPGNLNYGNVIINNTLTGNGLPGVAMHIHAFVPNAPAPSLNDNKIIGNIISGNGNDTDDAVTAGPTGINVFSVAPVTGIMVAGNTIRNEQIGVVVNTKLGDAAIHDNNLTGQTGVDNLGTGSVNAVFNYWGCDAGPGTNNCAGVLGAVIAAAYATSPF